MKMLRCLLGAAFALAPFAAGAAVITDGNVSLGVTDFGGLNSDFVGLEYVPSSNDGIYQGCLCEGWGAGIATAGGAAVTSGYSNANSGNSNVTLVSFESTATTATSVTDVGGALLVTHSFALAEETDDLYRVSVTIVNTSGAVIEDLRYTRAMDWDVEPTVFNEYVTIDGTAEATAVLYAGDNGFASGNPFDSRTPLVAGAEGDFTDSGPSDHGAIFDFSFGTVGIGESVTFDIFYGAAPTEVAALEALNAVEAEVFSLGQSSFDPNGTGEGGSDTFIFGFSGVGGVVVPPPSEVPVPATALLLLTGLGGIAGFGRLRRRT